MPGYITPDDIVQAYGQAQFDKCSTPKGAQQPVSAVSQKAIDSASSIIDMYIGNRYTLPLQVVPPGIVEMAIDIAIYKMSLDTTVRTTEMKVRYDDALKMLSMIATGQASLGLSNADLATNGDADVVKQSLGKSIRTYRT